MAGVGEILGGGAQEPFAPADTPAQLECHGDGDVHPRFIGEGDDRLDAIECCPEVAIGEVGTPDAEQEPADGPRRGTRDERVEGPLVEFPRRLCLSAQLREAPLVEERLEIGRGGVGGGHR